MYNHITKLLDTLQTTPFDKQYQQETSCSNPEVQDTGAALQAYLIRGNRLICSGLVAYATRLTNH